MFIEPTITWVPSGFSGYIWLDTKIVLKKAHLLNHLCTPHSIISIDIEKVIQYNYKVQATIVAYCRNADRQ